MSLQLVQMWVTFAVIVGAIVLLASERVRLEVTCTAIIAFFLVFFHAFPIVGPKGANLLSPEALLAGFANPALLTILSLLVIGQGLFHTGAFEWPTRKLLAIAGRHSALVVPLLLLLVAVNSAFMNDTPVVVMYMPVLTALALRLRLSASMVLMPLSYMAILGGMTTLIGSSTNLLAAGVAARAGVPAIGFFDFTVVGAVLAGSGALYVLVVMPRMLRPRASMTSELTASQEGRQFIAQIELRPGHPLTGQRAKSGLFASLKDMTVRLVQRGEHAILPPFEDVVLQPGDIVIVAATRQVLTEQIKLQGRALFSGSTAGGDGEPAVQRGGIAELTLAEAVIAPGSRMIGRTIEQSGLHLETGCIVLGIQRRSRMIRMPLSDIRVEAGDVILVLGNRDQIRGLRLNRDLLVLEWSALELPHTERANLALGLFAVVVLSAATGLVPIVVAAFVGALAMVASGCLNVRQAARAFDRRIYLLIAASLAMAQVLEASGGASFLAGGVVELFRGAPAPVILSAFFLLIAILTNVLSNNATAVLFTPIGISTAQQLNLDPAIFVYAVIFAANCSFASPFGYQTNLLVMGPGHYSFNDFLRAGAPLVLLIWITFSLFAPWYYGLQ